MRTIRSFAWLVPFALPLSSFGSIFQVVQLSEPAGFLSQTDAIQQGTNHPSVSPNLSSNGYAFGYWTINDVRVAGPDGRSLTQVSSVIQTASTYKAHYFQESTDSDSDGIMDWFEYRMFGDLSRGPGNDPDGDGFTNQHEDQLAQDPLIKDLVRDGGLSSRTSTAFVYADTSMVKATIKSNPAGFVTQSENFLALNSNISTASLNGETNGYHFAYWSVNGVRQAAPNGTASSQVDLNVSVTSEIIAHYLQSNEDNDSDGVMDWFELNQFGSLTLGPNDDPDADGFSNKLEGELGQEARIKDLVRDGGLSSRTSTAFVYADTSMVQATIRSDPAGFVTQSENYLTLNANVSTASLNGETNGYHFAYWSVNGVRQTAPNGTSASQVDMNLTVTSQIVAHYLPLNEDSDSDGVMDWFELHQFGSLTLGPDDDPDGDGFSNKREGELGQEARVKDLVRDGGLSSRVSPSILYFLQVNNPPDGLDLNDTIVHANKPAGELVGIFQPSDPDDPNGQNAYQLSFLDGNGSTDKNLFTISGMNLLSSASLQVGNYSIKVRVMDDENASFDKSFTIQAIHDPNKDDDNDSLTYAQEQALGTSDSNPDTDGDGFGDAFEASYGSNPADPNSVANSPPTDLNSTAPLSVTENQPVGKGVGVFHATDLDTNATLSYTLVNGVAQNDNSLFTLDTNGTLKTATIFDYESNASTYTVRVEVTDEHNTTIAGDFTIYLINEIEDLDGDGIENHIDNDYNKIVGDINTTTPSSPTIFVNRPIPQTLPVELLSNETYRFSGKILTDGGAPIFEVGIILSKKIFLSDPIQLISQLDQQTMTYHSLHGGLEPGTTYYFRAYAKNRAGMTRGGLKKLTTPQVIEPGSWYANARPLPGGWRMLEWWGAFRPTTKNWVYHAELGWLYPSASQNEGLWLWNKEHGWQWTDDGVYPYLFRWRDSTWIYFYRRVNGRPLFYNGTLKRLE